MTHAHAYTHDDIDSRAAAQPAAGATRMAAACGLSLRTTPRHPSHLLPVEQLEAEVVGDDVADGVAVVTVDR